jgi:hypothetical protein
MQPLAFGRVARASGCPEKMGYKRRINSYVLFRELFRQFYIYGPLILIDVSSVNSCLGFRDGWGLRGFDCGNANRVA